MKHLPLYNQQFDQLCGEFSKMIKTKGYKGGDYFSSMIREFLFFIESKDISAIGEVKAKDIMAYCEYLRERPNQRREGGLSDSVIQKHLYMLRLLFDYLLDTDQIVSSPASLPKFGMAKYKARNIVTVEEIKFLYRACETKLDKALLGLSYGCGLRRSEIEKLNASDILFHTGVLEVREGKLGKTRTVPISDNVLRDLKEYLISERNQCFIQATEMSHSFLLCERGQRLKSSRYNGYLKRLILKTGKHELTRKEITIHCLRHSIATHLLDNGASIEFVKDFLGHVLLDTTHLYSKRRKQKQLLINAFQRVSKAA